MYTLVLALALSAVPAHGISRTIRGTSDAVALETTTSTDETGISIENLESYEEVTPYRDFWVVPNQLFTWPGCVAACDKMNSQIACIETGAENKAAFRAVEVIFK